jgi:hypothetical protein
MPPILSPNQYRNLKQYPPMLATAKIQHVLVTNPTQQMGHIARAWSKGYNCFVLHPPSIKNVMMLKQNRGKELHA